MAKIYAISETKRTANAKNGLPPNLLTKPKEWGAYVSFGQLVAASGFVGITFNQRFYGWDMKSLSDARSDVADASNYIKGEAEEKIRSLLSSARDGGA